VANYAIDRLIDDVAGLIDAGARGRPVTLLAHDWGALIAWAFAADAPRALDRMVIMNVPHPGVFFDLIRTDREQRRKSWYVAFFQTPWLPEWLLTANDARGVRRAFYDMAVDKTNFGPAVLDAYAANARLPGAMTAMVNYYRANFGVTGPMARFARGVVRPIDTPTLLIWGEADAALSVRGTEGYEGLVRDLTVRRLPNVSHWVQQEAPDTVNGLLGAWLGAPRPDLARP
jgi:pimeloyl-ACP methyl ester carboxylesterase